MPDSPGFVDIHCHLLPGIDDGSASWEDSLAMAEMAAHDGIQTVIVTPHQLGAFGHNHGDAVRQRTSELQHFLDGKGVPLKVMPGGDVRIEECLVFKIRSGEVLTLGDLGKHVLLELPHELYFPLEGVLDGLAAAGIVGILSHPERNQGILQQPTIVEHLVQYGCLMQVTAGSLMGTFGPRSQELAEQMLEAGQTHFLATDAHSPKSRRPLMRRAFEKAAALVGEETAIELCCANPNAVASGQKVLTSRPRGKRLARSKKWFSWRKAG